MDSSRTANRRPPRIRPPSRRSRTAIARTASSRRSCKARSAAAYGRKWIIDVRLKAGRYRAMTIKPFDPKFMKVGVLTAALQELTPREIRDPDPDKAIEDWVVFARELGADYIQLSSALHPIETDVPPEAMLY